MRSQLALSTALAAILFGRVAFADPLVVATPDGDAPPKASTDAGSPRARPAVAREPRLYLPRSPFDPDFPCWAIPRPRCGAYPLLAFGVQGGTASTEVGWERVVRPYVEAGVMTSVGRWIDFGTGLLVAYDKLESVTAASVETKLRLRMWMPSGFFGDLFVGPSFERYAYRGTETGTRAGVVLGASFSFSEILGLEGSTTYASAVGGQGGGELRYMLGVRFSLPTLAFAALGIGYAMSKK